MIGWPLMRAALMSLSCLSLLSACVDEDTLSVYGLAERYQGRLELTSGDCQSGAWSLNERSGAQTLLLKQTESADLKLSFDEGAPLYAQLCQLEGEAAPRGLCLYGEQLKSYQVNDPNRERPLSCQLWVEFTEIVGPERCCEQVELGHVNTLKLNKEGGLEGTLERRLSLSPSEEGEAAEALCGGPLQCRYQVTLQMEASP